MSPADKMQQIRVAHGQTIARMSCLVESPILHRQRYVHFVASNHHIRHNSWFTRWPIATHAEQR